MPKERSDSERLDWVSRFMDDGGTWISNSTRAYAVQFLNIFDEEVASKPTAREAIDAAIDAEEEMDQ